MIWFMLCLGSGFNFVEEDYVVSVSYFVYNLCIIHTDVCGILLCRCYVRKTRPLGIWFLCCSCRSSIRVWMVVPSCVLIRRSVCGFYTVLVFCKLQQFRYVVFILLRVQASMHQEFGICGFFVCQEIIIWWLFLLLGFRL